MANLRHLATFDPHEVDHIQATERETLLANQLRSGEVAEFIKRHGNVLMLHSREGGYYHNAEPVEGFTSIILKAC